MHRASSILLLTLGLSACGPGDGGGIGATGSVQVFVVPEDTILDGLAPGTGPEDIQDGWTVEYSRFLIVVGNFRARRSAKPDVTLSDPKLYAVDLKSAPAAGVVVSRFADVAAERWDKVGYDLGKASAATVKTDTISQADLDLLVGGGYSLVVEGKATKADGRSCRPTAPMDCVDRPEVRFRWRLASGTSFDDCAPETGDSGFAVPAKGTAQVKPTIHGDHWFFSNVTQGAEVTARYAQWIADADLDRDGETTLDEMKATRASDLLRAPTYNLSGGLLPIMTVHDYFAAQAHTLGDFQGSGECPTRALIP